LSIRCSRRRMEL